MSRIALLLALAVAAGCSSPQKKVPRLGEDTETETDTFEAAADRPPMQEADGCVVQVLQQMPTESAREYIIATESTIVKPREEFRATCGSAIVVMHNWSSFWESAGYDNGEAPGAVTDATIAFIDATRPYCEGADGGKFRDGVRQVVVTATDTPDRVGACFDDKTKSVILRVMLEPGSDGISYWDANQLVEWYDTNL